MTRIGKLCVWPLAAALAGCGSSTALHKPPGAPVRTSATAAAAGPSRRSVQPPTEALVTAETENRLLVVDLRAGRVVKRIAVASDPENVASDRRVAVVVSSRAGTVTVLDRRSQRAVKVVGGFGSPHVLAISPSGRYAYVTDDARGTVTAIPLSDGTVGATAPVGAGAHHLTSSPDGRRLWISLGESASTIAILDTSDPSRLRVIGRFRPGFPAHDVSFTPDGERVWVTSATGTEVAVFSSRKHRLLFRVPVGPPPQHVVFAGPYAFLTSGYGDTIEKVALGSGRLLYRTSAPHGSFELDAGRGFVASASLLLGTLAIYDSRLELLHVLHLAPAARDVVIATP